MDLSLRKYKAVTSLTPEASPSSGSFNIPTQTQPTLSELWEKYSQFKKPQVSPSTYCKDFTKQKNHISRFPSNTLEDAALIRNYLLENLTLDAAKRCLTQVKTCCNWAVDEKLIEVNPFLVMKIKKLKGSADDDDINPFSKVERDLIIKTFSEDANYRHYTNYVRFLFSTSARPSEAIALQWKHSEGNMIKFRQTIVVSEDGLVLKQGLKTQKKRDFPITATVQVILDDLKPESRNPEAFLFRSPHGHFFDQHNFSTRAWKSVLKKCNIPYRKSYQCRHTFISLCVEENVNSTLIGRWVGTSSKMIDTHYGATDFPNSKPPDLT